MVPISLIVSLELVKFNQAIFMSYDLNMFDEETGIEMKAQSSNLNEELGQVEYVFSDKTGTLTCNIMEFKKFSAGNTSYGTDLQPTMPQEDNVCFHDPDLFRNLGNTNIENYNDLGRVMFFLATCHTIVID